MEGDGLPYNYGLVTFLKGATIWTTGQNLMVMLMKSGSPSQAHYTYADSNMVECVGGGGTGYVAGGMSLDAFTPLTTGTTSKAYLTSNPVWAALDLSAGQPTYAVIYRNSNEKPLLGYWAITTATNGGSYTLQFPADGSGDLPVLTFTGNSN